VHLVPMHQLAAAVTAETRLTLEKHMTSSTRMDTIQCLGSPCTLSSDQLLGFTNNS
jgi:hypothetical protein